MHVSPAFHPSVGQERAQTRTLNKLMSLWPVQQVILERVLTCSVGTAGGDRGLIDRGLVVGGVVLVSHGGALERVRYDSGTAAGVMCEVVMGSARPKRRFSLMGYLMNSLETQLGGANGSWTGFGGSGIIAALIAATQPHTMRLGWVTPCQRGQNNSSLDQLLPR